MGQLTKTGRLHVDVRSAMKAKSSGSLRIIRAIRAHCSLNGLLQVDRFTSVLTL